MNSVLRRSVFLRRFSHPLRYVLSRRYITEESTDVDNPMSNMKTRVTIMSQEVDDAIFFLAYSTIGFRLSNGMRVMGPCAAFPRSVLHWNVAGLHDVDEAALSLFTMLEPKLDILVLGIGEHDNLSKVNPNIIRYLQSKKINLEVLSTDQAVATFNFLNSERRNVAGALIPPTFIKESEGEPGDDRDDALISDFMTDNADGRDDDDLTVTPEGSVQHMKSGIKIPWGVRQHRARDLTDEEKISQARDRVKEALKKEQSLDSKTGTGTTEEKTMPTEGTKQ